MKIGLSSFAFRWAFKAGMSADDFLEKAAGMGAEVVQLCENAGLDRLDERDLGELAKHADRLGLTLECGGSSGDAAEIEAGIRRTVRLRGSIYRCVLDSTGLAQPAVIDNLRAVVPMLKECGVVLCAENHSRFSPATLRRIVMEVDDPVVAVCLDPLNSLAQLIGPDETIRELIGLTRTAHVKDARIRRSGTGFVVSGVPLGEGQLNVSNYVKAVAARVETLLLESWMEPDDGQTGARTLEQEVLWAESGLALIRNLTHRSS